MEEIKEIVVLTERRDTAFILIGVFGHRLAMESLECGKGLNGSRWAITMSEEET
ncbi:hypothetical protein Csa_019401 [Cucumis sativus]|uniref:Uncharacterized protein n=1 Tax=Cucumis sativus TaxID=3659 RepID=A0A0A0LIV5_CUCSA|nr:hypothetical protein Csa_019401 [Cucumis sativus]